MPSREQELERQLAEVKKAREYVLAKVGDCVNVADGVKVRFYNELVPFIKAAFLKKVREGSFDVPTLKDVLYEKATKFIAGEDYQSHLEKL